MPLVKVTALSTREALVRLIEVSAPDVKVAANVNDLLQIFLDISASVVVVDLECLDRSSTRALLERSRSAKIATILVGSPELALFAIELANEFVVFRVLIEPTSERMAAAVAGAASHHARMTWKESELERTVSGCVEALSEALAVASPSAFGRSRNLRRIVGVLIKQLDLKNTWELELAASLSQLGAISLPHDLLLRSYLNERLTVLERVMIDNVISVGCSLVNHIPELAGTVRLMRSLEDERLDVRHASIFEGVLRVACWVERQVALDIPISDIINELEASRVDPILVAAVRDAAPAISPDCLRSVSVAGLAVGMLLAVDVRSTAGARLIPAGREVSLSVITRLVNFHACSGVVEPILVKVRSSFES
jgi:hypothetical protein